MYCILNKMNIFVLIECYIVCIIIKDGMQFYIYLCQYYLHQYFISFIFISSQQLIPSSQFIHVHFRSQDFYVCFLYARLQTGRIMVWWCPVCPGLRPSVHPSVRHSFPHFSRTCFEILSWNFVYHFILHLRSSLNAINFRQFLLELCPFWTSNSYKYAVFRTFLLLALTYWAEILYMTLFYCTTDQVRVSSICINFCRSYVPFGT